MLSERSDVERWLLARAESYGRDGSALRATGDKDAALLYETLRDELRRCADDVAACDGERSE